MQKTTRVRKRDAFRRDIGVHRRSLYMVDHIYYCHLPSKQVSFRGTGRTSSNGRLPIGLVHKHGAKVTDNVNDTKHETVAREHSQVRALFISADWTARVLAGRKKSFIRLRIRVPVFAKRVVVSDRLVQERVDLVTGNTLT